MALLADAVHMRMTTLLCRLYPSVLCLCIHSAGPWSNPELHRPEKVGGVVGAAAGPHWHASAGV